MIQMVSKRQTRVSLTEAKQNFGELIKRVAYGGERFVIESRGRPQAAIVPCEERPRLSREEQLELLDRMTAFRKQIEAETGIQEDSAEIIRQMRDERDEQLSSS
jgi:prevent-host-death family protein